VVAGAIVLFIADLLFLFLLGGVSLVYCWVLAVGARDSMTVAQIVTANKSAHLIQVVV
jgi:hypothetical protein